MAKKFKDNVLLMNSLTMNQVEEKTDVNPNFTYVDSDALVKQYNDFRGKHLTTEVPIDGNMYIRQNNNWVKFENKILDNEPPNDTYSYCRKNKTWVRYYITVNSETTVSTIQGNNATLFVDALIPTEYKNTTYVFDGIVENSVINGTVSLNETEGTITFTPTTTGGETAEFQYKLVNSTDENDEVHVTVVIEIKRLPTMESYFFDSLVETNSYIQTFTPPTLKDVFNTWARFSDWINYYPSGVTPSGDAAQWTMSSETQFKCTVNSTTLTGFVSPKSYTDYIHEATFASTDSDDDLVALILAFKYVNGKNKVLLAVRTGNSNQSHIPMISTGFGIVYYDGSVSSIISKPIASFGSMGAWSTISPTRVYTSRSGSVFTCKCSNYKSTVYNDSSFLQIDIKNYPELSWALDAAPYGYACLSQLGSTFYDVQLSGGTDAKTIYSVEGNKLYQYSNNAWTITQNKSIQELYGYPRTVINPITLNRYEIQENNVIKVN